MTQQFREGDEVEVQTETMGGLRDETWHGQWRKATVVQFVKPSQPPHWLVQFPDGTRAVFDAKHIRLSKEQVEQDLIENGERFLDAMGDEVAP